MNRNAQLQLLARVRKQRQQILASDMAKARIQIKQQQLQLLDMLKWKSDYKGRLPGADDKTPVTAARLGQWRQFLDGLDKAVEKQRQIITASESRLSGIINLWREAERDSQVAEQLLDDMKTEQRQIDDRVEQDAADDAVCGNRLRSQCRVSA